MIDDDVSLFTSAYRLERIALKAAEGKEMARAPDVYHLLDEILMLADASEEFLEINRDRT